MTGAPSILPPQPPGLRRLLLRWWRSRDALPRLQRWLLLRAVPVLVVFVVLYSVNGLLVGWTDAYNVLTGIESPGDVSAKWCAWPLSVAGWAALPALIGGFVGYLVTGQIQAHRTEELAQIIAELSRRATEPSEPGAD
ncbi:DUF6313 family protein [Streptomyces sp. NPDC006627]|uniref:DUF6313 family protein n=1 Tax=Streptomyces sp. NPDC006627 TaxID=3154679 RepID=UPI0033A92745